MKRAPRVVSLFLAATVALSGLPAYADGRPAGPPPVTTLVTPTVTPAPDSPPPSADVPPGESSADIAAAPSEPLPAPTVAYRRRYNMAILGAGLLLATWGADRLLTRDLPSPYKEPPWIPIIGPWFLLRGQTQTAAPNQFTMTLLVFDGLLQAGGLTVGILGLVLHKKRLTISLPPPPPRAAP
jgi:hypothetical protein